MNIILFYLNLLQGKRGNKMLKEIFEEQLKLNKKIIPNLYDILYENVEIKREWLNKNVTAIALECAELIESSGWKWWKKLPEWDEDNIHNLKVELIDILHFLVSAMIVMNMTAEDVYNLYMKKKQLNVDRQDNGYKDGTYKKFDDNGKEDNYYLKEDYYKK